MNNKALSFFGRAACLMLATLMGVMLMRTVTAGASAYHASRRALETSYSSRTLVDYATAKALGGNEKGRVYVGNIEGLPCLTIEEEYEGELYITQIYCLDGMLKELFCLADSGMGPTEGMDIVPCRAFEPSQVSPDLIYLSFDVDGEESFGYVSVIGEEGAE